MLGNFCCGGLKTPGFLSCLFMNLICQCCLFQTFSDANSEDLQLAISHGLNMPPTSLLMLQPVLTKSLPHPQKVSEGMSLVVTRCPENPGTLHIRWLTVSPLVLSHRVCKPACLGYASVSPFALLCPSWDSSLTLESDSFWGLAISYSLR